MNQSNVIEASDKFVSPPPPTPASNENSKSYTRFAVINWHTNSVMSMTDDDIIANATYRPVNFVEFLEMSNHGKFDQMDEPHLVVLQSSGERTILAIVIAVTLQ